MIKLLLLMQLAMPFLNEEQLERERMAAMGGPYHKYIVTIIAQYEDGGVVNKGETRCLGPGWEAYDVNEEHKVNMEGVWFVQDSRGATILLSAVEGTDPCEARDKQGRVGKANITWGPGASWKQYIVIRR